MRRRYRVIARSTGEQLPPHVYGQDDDGSPVVYLPHWCEIEGADYWLDEDGNAHVMASERAS